MVCGYAAGHSVDPQLERIGSIHRVERPSPDSDSGQRLITNYSIDANHFGVLELRKHSHSFGPEDIRGASSDWHTIGHQIAQQAEAEASEDDIGLSFVSEAEARRLIALITEGQARGETKTD